MSELTGTPRTAYVLDDDAGIRFVACHILTSNGYTASAFADAPSFLSAVRNAPPETVIVDLALGTSDAVEIIRDLATACFTGKVMLFSGRDEETLKEISGIGKSRGLAMLPPLHKPFRAADLQRCLFAEPDVRLVAKQSREAHPTIELSEALASGWLELWYQPKINLETGLVIGAEGLIRARHPVHGIMPPVSFLPPGDDPLHEDLARFVITRAMADWQEFAAAGLRIKLAVNVPVTTLRAPGFVAMVRELLPANPKFPGLIVEVTEDEAIQDALSVKEVVAQLKLNNIWLSVDDFGAAYSSLSRLLDLSCVELKLDRSFVADCSSDDIKRAICKTVIDLAHQCGVSVCAEGIEESEDLRALVTAGCDTGQGYLFGKPMPLADFLRDPEILTNRAKAEVGACAPGTRLRVVANR